MIPHLRLKKKIQLKRVQSLHPVSQIHHRRAPWSTVGRRQSTLPHRCRAAVFLLSQLFTVLLPANQTPPLVSLSLSSLHALHHPSSLHPSWNTAGGWSFVSVTNHFSRACTSPNSSLRFISLLNFQHYLWLDLINKIDKQARSQSLLLYRRHWSDSKSHSLSWGGGGGVAGWFPWQPPWQQLHGHDCCETVDSKFAHAGNKQPLRSHCSGLGFPRVYKADPLFSLTYSLVNISTARSSAGHNNHEGCDNADKARFCRCILYIVHPLPCEDILKPIRPLLTTSAWKIIRFIDIHRTSIHILVIYILSGIQSSSFPSPFTGNLEVSTVPGVAYCWSLEKSMPAPISVIIFSIWWRKKKNMIATRRFHPCSAFASGQNHTEKQQVLHSA